eukprot:375925_1
MLTPPSTVVAYLGWIVAGILLCVLMPLVRWLRNRRFIKANNIICNNKYKPSDDESDLMVNLLNIQKPAKSMQEIVDISIYEMFLKSEFSVCQDVADFVNTIIFLIYFEYFSGLTVTSVFGRIHIIIFSFKILLQIIDITQNMFHIIGNKQIKSDHIIMFNSVRVHFNLLFILYTIFFSYGKLSNPATFWSSVLFVANFFKSFYEAQVKRYYVIYDNMIQELVRLKLREIVDQQSAANNGISVYVKPKEIPEPCIIKYAKKLYKLLHSKLDDIVVFVPCIIIANCIVYSMLILGPLWIILTFIVWLLFIFTVSFCGKCHCQAKIWLIDTAFIMNLFFNIAVGFGVFIYHIFYPTVINKQYKFDIWSSIHHY